MSEHPILSVDPWLKESPGAPHIPPESTFLCTYGVYVGIDTFDEQAFFRRTADRDELWLTSFLTQGRAVVAHIAGDVRSASGALLDVLFRARGGFGSPNGLTLGGAIDADTFQRIIETIEREFEENAQEANRRKAEIVVAARELGLGPEPTGTSSHNWRARCPGTNHRLAISSATNQFGCGYCRRKGGPGELRSFTEERRPHRILRSRE